MDKLTAQNATLQAARNPEGSLHNASSPLHNIEHSRTPTVVPPIVNLENKEENSHIDAWLREEGNPSNCEEGSSERIICREPNLENLS
jgi:hypothetical protein